MSRSLLITALALLSPALVACGSSDSGSSGSGTSGSGASSARSSAGAPAFRAADFPPVPRVDNPWFPLPPGTTMRYRGAKDGKPAYEVLTVTARMKTILGVRAVVVHDRLYMAGRLAEETFDWYAQDRRGTVWYLGEDTRELDARGRTKSTEGSFQAGVDGARAGIFMPASPRVGQVFQQEHYAGQAEDFFKIVSLDAPVRVPAVSSSRAMRTREWTPLEPGVIDRKYYVRGLGTVSERTVKGGDEFLELVSFKRP